MSNSLGLRNWRGQIIEPLANYAQNDVPSTVTADAVDPDTTKDSPKRIHKKEKKKKKKHSRRHRDDEIEYVKDEFGRDVPVTKKRSPQKRSRSVASPRRGTTPPPADPIRPQLDERRDTRRRHRSRSRSRSKRRQRRRDASRSRSRSSSRCHRHRRRSRSRSRSREHDRPWTHDGFENRSPSPMRTIDPGYKPEPEQWVSRAGGVYLPRKS